MIRPSSKFESFRRAGLLLFLTLPVAICACGSRDGGGPRFATAAALPDEPRRPDGVVVDPSPELPAAAEAGDPASTLVALTPPLPDKAARGVVAAFFHAVVAEDVDALAELATPDASASAKARGGSSSIVDHWRTRMRHFRYRTLVNDVLYQDADIELYRYDDLETAAVGRPARPPEMAHTDLLLRVPLVVVRAGNERAFGDEIVFLLRREKERLRIREIFEDFQIP